MEWITQLDNLVSSGITAIRNPVLTRFFQMITQFGSVFVIILVSLGMLGYFAYHKKWTHFRVFFFTVTLGEIMNETLKWAFHRERPPLPWLTDASGYSFPSGHTLMSTITYGIIAYLLFVKDSRRKLHPAAICLFVLPVLVGISRVYLGVHFTTDVLGGWILGILWIKLVSWLNTKH
ncbi:MAG TPA: phosphatase PAP2 family protein [Bacillota bacterium]|nr:phosphatase PAP2 family protein [Bacillota bacterium]